MEAAVAMSGSLRRIGIAQVKTGEEGKEPPGAGGLSSEPSAHHRTADPWSRGPNQIVIVLIKSRGVLTLIPRLITHLAATLISR